WLVARSGWRSHAVASLPGSDQAIRRLRRDESVRTVRSHGLVRFSGTNLGAPFVPQKESYAGGGRALGQRQAHAPEREVPTRSGGEWGVAGRWAGSGQTAPASARPRRRRGRRHGLQQALARMRSPAAAGRAQAPRGPKRPEDVGVPRT